MPDRASNEAVGNAWDGVRPDVFAFPSLTETFGQSVQEAMAGVLRVVGYDSDGVRDLVSSGRDGQLASSTLRAELGGRARAAAERRTWTGVMDGLLATYEEIIESRRARAA